ncbi:hypothetical protein DFH06DRAFT_1199226 [Mycena polygramma]|nr:hypothetical protein DFH06DRAFT_1199226 [Mycena polygramma]
MALAAVKRAVLDYVNSSKYEPPQFPSVFPEDWDQLVTDATAAPTAEDALSPGDGLRIHGKEVFDFVLFVLLSEDLLDKPAGFLQTARQAISSTEVLRAVMVKVDERMLRGGLESVEAGFHTFVGHAWGSVGKNTEAIIKWLKTVFGTLTEVATAAYAINFKPPRKTARKSTKKPETEAAEADLNLEREKCKSSAVRFLENLRDLQAADEEDDSDTSESDVSRGVIFYSPPAIPAFRSSSLSPLNPAILRSAPPLRLRQAARQGDELEPFSIWAEIPSLSNIEAELGLPDAVDERPQDEGQMAAVQAYLMPAAEISARSTLRSAFVNQQLGVQLEQHLAALTISAAGPGSPKKDAILSGTPATNLSPGKPPRRPLTPANL